MRKYCFNIYEYSIHYKEIVVLREQVKKQTCILSGRIRLGINPPPPRAVNGDSDFMQFFFAYINICF